MAVTQNTYTGNGSTVLYSLSFSYLDETDVKVTVNGTLVTNYIFATASSIQFATAPAAGAAIRIYRDTDTDQTKATFFAGSAVRASDLNANFIQTLYSVQEIAFRALSKIGDTMQGILNMGGFKITNLGAPTSGTDATTKTYVDTQDALKVNKAGDTMSGNLAMGGNKVTGLGSPSGSADAATKSYVDGYINTTYLGPSATDPTTRPGGAPLQVGDQYFNTNQNILKAWTGTVWVISAAAGSIIRWRKTASAGNTTLSGVDDLGITLSYVVGNEQVYLNGALQTRGVDYTAATGTSITFTPALLAGDVVELHAVQGYVSATITPGSINDALVAPAAGIQASKLSFTQTGAGAVARTVDGKLKDTIHVKDFGAVGDGTTDDTAAIQAAITAAAGKTLVFDAVTYKTTSTLTISSHGTKLHCRDATIDYYGTAAAIGFGLVNGTTYPVEVEIHNLNIVVNNGPSSTGVQVRTSYSRYYDVGILLKAGAASAKGFVLVGDETNGTGPYYNLFQGCVVQSGSGGSAVTGHIGFQCSTQAPLYRAANANTWVGGRIGQCATGFLIAGNGNTFFHPTVENQPATGVAFDFVGPQALGCVQCNVFGAYVENASTAFRFNSNSNGNGVFNPYITGASTFISDSGTENLYITSNAPSRLSTGVKFGTLSSDASVLDYYEEGTWTPTLVGSTTAGSYTITTTTAKYTRIGRLVHVSALMAITINSAGSGTARFGGLPFAKGSATVMSGSAYLANFALPAGNSGVSISHWTSSADSTFYLVATRSATSPYDILCSDINSGAYVVVNFTYTV